MVFYLDMSRTQDNLQMTFINRSVVNSRAVTILRSNETYLRIGGLPLADEYNSFIHSLTQWWWWWHYIRGNDQITYSLTLCVVMCVVWSVDRSYNVSRTHNCCTFVFLIFCNAATAATVACYKHAERWNPPGSEVVVWLNSDDRLCGVCSSHTLSNISFFIFFKVLFNV